MTGGVAAIHAYLADTSNESNRWVRGNKGLFGYPSNSSRTRIFALSLGLLFTGTALGPSIGGLLIHFTGQVLSVFYLAGCLHLLYSCWVWFIIPESLTKGHMELAKIRYADRLHATSSDPDNGFIARFIRNSQRLFFFLRPLAIFGPIEDANRNGLKGPKKDWNLTLLIAAYGFTVALMVSVLKCIFTKFLAVLQKGSYNYMFQYAAATFGWSSEIVGYLAYLFFYCSPHHPTAWILDEYRERGSRYFSSADFTK